MWRWFYLPDILCLTSSSIIAGILKSIRELTSPYFYRTNILMEKEETFPEGKACSWQGLELWLRVSKVIFPFHHRFSPLSCTRFLKLCAWAKVKNIFLPLTAVMTVYHMVFKGKTISSLCACLCREGRSCQGGRHSL